MAHAFSLTDGTTTIDLADEANTWVLAYVPTAPEVSQAGAAGVGDGDELSSVNLRNVTDTIEMLLVESTKPALQNAINALESMLFAANRRQRSKTGPKVYLQMQVDGEADTWRSEIMSGRVVLDNTVLDRWANIKAEVKLHITRRYWWEGAETEIELSTSNAAAATGGQTIYNHDDSGTGHDNWVEIANTEILGNLPTPVKITLTNNVGSGQGYYKFYIATNAYNDPANFVHILEGEAASGLTSTTANANYSDGNYGTKSSWTGTAELYWTIPSATLTDGAGRFFRVLASIFNVSIDFYARAYVRDSYNLITLFEGDEVLVDALGDEMVDLGTIPLPPATVQGVTWDDLTLAIKMRTASSNTMNIDFVQLTPLDSYVEIIQRGYSVADGETVTIDGIDGIVHAEGMPIYTSVGMPLLVFPGRTQRIIVLHMLSNSTVPATNTLSIRAYYRPRRATV